MRLRVQTDHFTTLLLAALGLAPVGACGGTFATNVGDGGPPGSGGGAGDGAAGTGFGTGGDFVGAGGDIIGTGGSSTGTAGTVIEGTGGYVGTGGGVPTSPFSCIPVPVMVPAGSSQNQFVRCANNMVHRPYKVDCQSSLPRPDMLKDVPDAGIMNQCTSDADCTAKPHGYCDYPDYSFGPRPPYEVATCSYGCVRDEECGMNQICVCGNPVGHCESASCSTDAECGAGLVCGTYTPNPGCPGEAFACQTYVDQCAADTDCMPPSQCTFQQGHRVCSPIMCAVGRPFLIEGHARLASRTTGDDWSANGARPDVSRFAPADRARLGEEWTKIGLMEHASIAAFARFTLQLMSLRAPADLIERSNAAQRDETLHAKLAFGIASAYTGRDIGPGPLDIRGALEAGSLQEIVVNVIREGCIGETVAAVEAAEALEHAVDPAVRDALARVAHDELTHADLAWRFVRWALDQGGEALRDVVRKELERARPQPAAVELDGEARTVLLMGGILPPSLKREVHATTLEQVVRVCARALLSESGALADVG
jgi:hypothetical protein